MTDHDRSNQPDMFCETLALKNLADFSEKNKGLQLSSLFKKRLRHMFFCQFYENLKNMFFTEHLRSTASAVTVVENIFVILDADGY